jgi:hypothetical protein
MTAAKKTVPSSERTARGQVQLSIRLTVKERTALLAIINRHANDGEPRGETLLRLLRGK